ncbi:MAG: RNA polymerase sigma factor [Myxococcales bacterium]
MAKLLPAQPLSPVAGSALRPRAPSGTLIEPDAMLVQALRARDLAAAARFYDRYAPKVRGMVYRVLGADTELDDVVQDVFVAAITSIHKLRDPAMLKSWLLGIAVGRVRDNLRARWRRRWLTFHPFEELLDHPAPLVESQADVAKEVGAILDRLPPEERIALLLHRLEGLSLEEAAQTCNMTVSTFKRRLARGEAKFILRAKYRPALIEWRASNC